MTQESRRQFIFILCDISICRRLLRDYFNVSLGLYSWGCLGGAEKLAQANRFMAAKIKAQVAK
ncbi:protein of unknown function [Magnetospirillum sp. XM-1]|nr:protein of unknown function [Magnetospirillum sp. XM-1]